MKFILFSGFLWIVAMFHMWDHHRFESDLRRYMDGVRGLDWREVGGDGRIVLKRAFRIADRADVWRYAAPVVLMFVWLLVFRYWTPALIYMLAVSAKWFAAQTRVDSAQRSYCVTLFGKKLLSARLD